MNLVLLLAPVIRMLGGRALASPIDVFMSHADPVQPDFVALLPGGAARVSARGVEGPPDLVIEVLSTSSATHDNARKRDLYGRAGVGEFWIVDPAARSVAVLAHGPAGLRPALAFAGDDNLVSPLLLGAEFPLAAIFADLDGIQD